MAARLVLVACACLAVAGCTATGQAGAPRAVSTTTTTTTASSVLASTPPVTTAAPPTSTFQRGVAVYWPDNTADTLAVVRAKADRILTYATGLGANAVSISFPVFSDGPTSSSVHLGPTTPTPARLAVVVRDAEQRGLEVTLRPTLDEAALRPDWRGMITPTDRNAWFASYATTLEPYLEMAQQTHVPSFAIGTEFNTLQGDPHWAGLVTQARTVYHGQLTYSQDWSSYSHDPGIPVDSVGLDAYFGVNLPDTATISQIQTAWDAWFAHLPRTLDLSNLVLDEVSIPAQAGAYHQPNIWSDPSRPQNDSMQATWFTAACQFAHGHHLAGLYFWKLDFHAVPGSTPEADRGVFVNRPAQDAIRTCFTK